MLYLCGVKLYQCSAPVRIPDVCFRRTEADLSSIFYWCGVGEGGCFVKTGGENRGGVKNFGEVLLSGLENQEKEVFPRKKEKSPF